MKFVYSFLGFAALVLTTNAVDICRYSEVSIVLDVSGSIIPKEFESTKEFTSKLVDAIGISKQGNRIAVATFADWSQKEIYCEDHETTTSFKDAVSDLTQYGDFTNIQDGLKKGKDLFFERGCGDRPTEPSSRVLILMTDGEANRGDGFSDLFKMADEIRDMGIKIFAVGVGGANIGHLRRIAGSNDNVVQAKNFDELLKQDIIFDLTSAVCTSPAPETTTTTEETTTTTEDPTTTTTTEEPTTTTTTEEPTTTTTTEEPTTTTTTEEPTTTTTTEEPTTTTTEEPTTTTTTEEPTTTTTTEESTTTTTTEEPTTTTTTEEPTTTTTTEEPTTTTTTEEPTTTTTTEMSTTTTEETTTPNKPDEECSCVIEKDMYPCIKWTKWEIIKKFEGKCYLDKLIKAIAYIQTRITHLENLIKLFIQCKDSVKVQIQSDSTNIAALFLKYDQCTVNTVCKLQRWKVQMIQRIELLKKEKKLEEEGFGGLTMPNPWQYLMSMMKMKK